MHDLSFRRTGGAAALALLGLPGLALRPAAAAPKPAPVPLIQRLSPALAPAGALVRIAGKGLKGATFVSFNRVPAQFTVNSDAEITAVVPSGAVSGLVRITAPGGSAVGPAFTRGTPQLTVTALTPTQGAAGGLVQITGSGFTGATSVKLRGKPARFLVVSDTTITVTVPSGAATGPLTVSTPYGVASSPSFTVR